MSARPLRDLFAVFCSTANLHRAAARTLARGRRFSREGAAFALRLEERVAVLNDELSSGSYRHGRYTLFTVLDPKPRVIAAAGVRDRVVHHAVHDVIEPVLDRSFVFDSYACRRGKGTHRALDRAHHFLRGRAFVLHDRARCWSTGDRVRWPRPDASPGAEGLAAGVDHLLTTVRAVRDGTSGQPRRAKYRAAR